MFKRNGIDFRFRSRGVSSRDGYTLTRRTHTGGEFEEITPYLLWDESRAVDMKRSIFETNTLYSKRMTESREYTLSVIIPLTPSMRFGTEEWSISIVILEALTLIVRDLNKWGHTGEIILLTGHTFEVFPLTRPVDIERFKKVFISHLRNTESSIPLSSAEIIRLTHHLCRTADLKVATLSSEELVRLLRDRIISLHIPLHEFVFEHSGEIALRQGLLARLRWVLRNHISPESNASPVHTRTLHTSITRIYTSHSIFLWLIQGFRQLG